MNDEMGLQGPSDSPIPSNVRMVEPKDNPLKRIVVSEAVYHCDGETETCVGKPWSLNLKTDELPYQRKHKLDGESVALLDVGWVKLPSMVLIENKGKNTLTVVVGRELVSCLPPGTSSRMMVSGIDLTRWTLEGKTVAVVTVFPS